MKTVAIVTATYNRATLLPVLYASLRAQTSFDFVWYVVDDGSSDNTEQVVHNFDRSLFDIKYLKKANGGRHTALNTGIRAIEETLVFPVDSDDWLDPRAIETIVRDWERFKDIPSIAGLSYYKMLSDGRVISDPYPGEDFVASFIDVRVNRHISGDSAEIYRTDVLKKHSFPEFPGEKFLSEAIIWHAIAQKFELVYIPKGIYYCEYREDGLTKSGRLKQLSSPKGTLLHAKAYMYRNIIMPIRAKYCCMYVAMSLILKIQPLKSMKESEQPLLFVLCFFPGVVLRMLWKKKYGI